jgi:sugar/nucleoside kinase (ribokinase family)
MDVRLIAAVGNDSAASLIRDTLLAERIATDTLIDLPGETDYSVIIVARGGENMIITSASQAESVTGRDVDRRVSISSGDARTSANTASTSLASDGASSFTNRYASANCCNNVSAERHASAGTEGRAGAGHSVESEFQRQTISRVCRRSVTCS